MTIQKNRRPGSKYIDEDTYARLVAAFIEKPGNYANAAAQAGTMEKTAKKAWNEGWPKLGLPAVQIRVKEEQIKARARAAEEALARKAQKDQELKQAQEAAATQLKEETMSANMARGMNLAIRAQAGMQVAKTMKQIGDLIPVLGHVEFKRIMAWADYDAKVVALDPTAQEPPFQRSKYGSLDAMLSIAQKAAAFSAMLTQNERAQMENARLVAGKPTDILQVQKQTQDVDVTGEEIELSIEAGLAVLERRRRLDGEVNERRFRAIVGEEVVPMDQEPDEEPEPRRHNG